MTRIKSPLDDAIHAARQDWMNSLVYCVLDAAAEDRADRNIRQEAQEFGAYETAEMLLKSARFDPETNSDSVRPWVDVYPWEAELLRTFTPSDIVLVVEQWTDEVPLNSQIDRDHAVEYAKLRRLQTLHHKLNQP